MSETRCISDFPDIRAINLWLAVSCKMHEAPGIVPHLPTLRQVKIRESYKIWLNSVKQVLLNTISVTSLSSGSVFSSSVRSFPPADCMYLHVPLPLFSTSFPFSNSSGSSSCRLLSLIDHLICFQINLPVFQILPSCLSHHLWMCLLYFLRKTNSIQEKKKRAYTK